jgi:predicted RNase H-like HicB family nuclease
MTTEIIEVVNAAQPDQLNIQAWTAVTDGGIAERPPGTPALLVLEGLGRALHVRIHEAEDGVSVADIATGVFGAGDTLPEALQDFRDALRDHLEVLADDDALSPGLQHQLEILRGYFTAH